MNMNADKIELALYRSGLIKSTARPYHIEQRVKTIRKHAGKFDRARLVMCNGIPRWNQKAQRILHELTEQDQTNLENQMVDARKAIETELRTFMQRGLIYDFRNDPRAAILRIVNKQNTKDAWID